MNKYMKKSLALSVIAAMLILSVQTISFAGYTAPTIEIGNYSAKPGDTVEIPVVMYNNPGIIALMTEVSYDKSQLTLVSAESTGLLGTGTNTFSKSLTDNPYILSWEDGLAPENHTENGTVAVLKFKVPDTAQNGTVKINLSFYKSSTYNYDLDDVEFDVICGSVTIGEEQEEPPVTPSYKNPTIEIGSYSAKPGDTVEVPVVMYNNPGIIALMTEVNYDKSQLTLISAESTGLLGTGTNTFSKSLTDNPYILSWEDGLAPGNHTENGTVAVLKFKISDTAQNGTAKINLSFYKSSTYNYNLDDVEFDVICGEVTIGESEPDTPGLTVKTGSSAVIENGFIGGLKTALTKEDFEKNFINIPENIKIEYSDDKSVLSTGTIVYLIKENSDSYETKYTIVIESDIDGDGEITVNDYQRGVNVALGDTNILKNDPDNPYLKAADIYADGVIDVIDLMYLEIQVNS